MTEKTFLFITVPIRPFIQQEKRMEREVEHSALFKAEVKVT
jgi:hypothetical protein